jgi:hypothetical protein
MRDKDYFNILIFGHATFKPRTVRIRRETFRILFYFFVFFQLAITFLFCDYIQVKKKSFLLSQLRQESQVQRSHIQLFSAKIEELEKKLSRLKDIDRRVRTIANLERGYEITPFIGMGGPPSSVTQWKLEEDSHKIPQSSDVNPSPH